MEMITSRQLERTLGIVIVVLASFAVGIPQQASGQQTSTQASSQHPDDLQKQLDAIKQQYAATTHDLEQRINALEQQIAKQKRGSREG